METLQDLWDFYFNNVLTDRKIRSQVTDSGRWKHICAFFWSKQESQHSQLSAATSIQVLSAKQKAKPANYQTLHIATSKSA